MRSVCAWPLVGLLLSSVGVVLSGRAQAQLDLAPLRALLDGRPARLVARDHLNGDKIFALDVDSGVLFTLNDDLAAESPLLSPDGTRVVYQQGGSVYIAPFDGTARTLVTAGYDPHWWVAPQGDEWIYYTTRGDDLNGERTCYYPGCHGIETRRVRLRDQVDEFVLAWKGNGGLSRDGTHLGAGEATMIIFDLVANQQYFVNEGRNACNPSMSPDNRYFLMHLTGTHQFFLFRDQQDNVVWQIKKPIDAEQWIEPEWSTDVDFATAASGESNGRASLCVVKISTSEYIRVLDARSELHNWSQPHLWVGPRREDGGATDHASVGEDAAGSADGGGHADSAVVDDSAVVGDSAPLRDASSAVDAGHDDARASAGDVASSGMPDGAGGTPTTSGCDCAAPDVAPPGGLLTAFACALLMIARRRRV